MKKPNSLIISKVGNKSNKLKINFTVDSQPDNLTNPGLCLFLLKRIHRSRKPFDRNPGITGKNFLFFSSFWSIGFPKYNSEPVSPQG